MKVLEVKNNLVKIEYTLEDNLLLSGFVIIEDAQSPYVAQVLSLKADNGINYAIVKLLFTFNEEGIVKNYDGTIPSLVAEVSKLASDELLDILPVNTPLEVGTIAHQGIDLKVDMSVFEKNLLICSDNTEDSNVILENFIYQLTDAGCKSVLFDADGSYPGKKLKFGEDFKLPLNYETINFIYDHDLNDIAPASKAIIQEIFLEVQEYSKTVLDKFIPFDTFLNVVDQQYKALGIPELVLLKNRLLKYREMNVFAQSPKEIHNLRSAIRGNLTNTLDISTADDDLQGEIMKYVYDSIDEMDLFVYSFVQLNNENTDKKLIRHFLNKNKLYTTFVSSHNFKYIYELKERATNLILFAPQVMQHDFNAYNTFLNKLNPQEFIIYGKATQNIPLIVELETMFEETPEEEVDPNSFTSQMHIATVAETPQEDEFSEESNSYSYQTLIEDSAPVQEETPQEEVTTEPQQEEVPEAAVEQTQKEEPVEPETTPTPEEKPTEETSEVEEETENNEEAPDEVASEPVEENEEEVSEEETVEETEETEEAEEAQDSEEEEEAEAEVDEEETEEEAENDGFDEEMIDTEAISNIIDKEIEAEIYTDPNNEDILEGEFQEVSEDIQTMPEVEALENPETGSQEDLTEDDLNFIQGVNAPVEEESTLPVYPAEELQTEPDAPAYSSGDHVSHPKYGEGIVEKIIRYGNKTLCSISFINVGRRLLDPAISELTKL